MFFSRKIEETNRLAKNAETSRRFAEKLAAITHINGMITNAIETTQAANCELLEKLKNHLKHGSRSFKSLSDKLMSGVLILDYKGKVLQSNPKAREILQNSKCVGHHITELIQSVHPVFPVGKPFHLDPQFFEELSNEIFESIDTCTVNKNSCVNQCLQHQDLPFDVDAQQLVQIKSPLLTENPYLKFSFSVLGNEPEELDDITYVVVFIPTSQTGSRARRSTD